MSKFTDLNKIYNEDCLETLSKIPDDYIDLVITPPPYNMNLRIRNGEYTSRQIVKEFSSKYHGFDDNLPIDDFYKHHSQIIKELLRTSNLIFYVIQIVTGSKRAFFKIIGDFNENLKDIIIWDKGVAQPAMQKQVLNRQSEIILVFEKDYPISRQFRTAPFERGKLNDVWNISRGKKLNKDHGAVFPEELVEKIITNFSNKKDVVYDPFLGTGTTAFVAKKLGRNYLGSELLESYFNFAQERLDTDISEQLDLLEK
jgi:site-specific DNA-methyltransferase (adenine-specific)